MLTKTAIAKRLGVSIETVNNWINSASLRAVDVSRSGSRNPRWRVTEESLSDFLESRSSLTKPKIQAMTKPRRIL